MSNSKCSRCGKVLAGIEAMPPSRELGRAITRPAEGTIVDDEVWCDDCRQQTDPLQRLIRATLRANKLAQRAMMLDADPFETMITNSAALIYCLALESGRPVSRMLEELHMEIARIEFLDTNGT